MHSLNQHRPSLSSLFFPFLFRDLSKLQAEATLSSGLLSVKIDGQKVELRIGREVFFSAAAMASAAALETKEA